MAFFERQPLIYPLHQLVAEVMAGDIIVPSFQRPGSEITWSIEQVGDLLDSIYRGFPIGTIMLWSTTTDHIIRKFDKVGGYTIKSKNKSISNKRFILDGHQRLSSLISTIGPGLVDDFDEIDSNRAHDINFCQWVFELSKCSNSRDRFVYLKQADTISPSQVPLSIIANRSKLNKWIRSNSSLTDEQISMLDELRDKVREYNIPVVVLLSESIEEAAESFKRVNSSGTPMDDFHMVAALSFTNEFDLQNIFELHRSDKLVSIQNWDKWSKIADLDILRICVALSGEKSSHPTKINVEKFSEILKTKKGSNLINDAFWALKNAIIALSKLGIHGPEALPYSWQLIILAITIGEKKSDQVNLVQNPRFMEYLETWFWVTTYGEAFAGINSAIYDRTKMALDDSIAGKSLKSMDRDITKIVRPVSRFDFRSARSKACLLSMARLQDKGDTNGKAHNKLAEGASSVQLIISNGKRSNWTHLYINTNPTEIKITDYVRKIFGINRGLIDNSMINSILSIDGYNNNTAVRDIEGLIRFRQEKLINNEKDFVKKLGLNWAAK